MTARLGRRSVPTGGVLISIEALFESRRSGVEWDLLLGERWVHADPFLRRAGGASIVSAPSALMIVARQTPAEYRTGDPFES